MSAMILSLLQPLLDFGAGIFGEYWDGVLLTTWTLIKIVAIVLPLMIAVAYTTLQDRPEVAWSHLLATFCR